MARDSAIRKFKVNQLKVYFENNCERAYRYVVSALYDPMRDGPPENSLEEMIADLNREYWGPDVGLNGSTTLVKLRVLQALCTIKQAAMATLVDRLHGRVPVADDQPPTEPKSLTITRRVVPSNDAAPTEH